MMRPQSALFYTEKLQDVADDFVKYVEQKRRSDLTNPGDFLDDLHDLALEHITAIALDTRGLIQSHQLNSLSVKWQLFHG